jgi:hypothetical protein
VTANPADVVKLGGTLWLNRSVRGCLTCSKVTVIARCIVSAIHRFVSIREIQFSTTWMWWRTVLTPKVLPRIPFRLSRRRQKRKSQPR